MSRPSRLLLVLFVFGALSACREGRHDPRAAWLKGWRSSLSPEEPLVGCPRLSLPNLPLIGLESPPLPYYAGHFELEWSVEYGDTSKAPVADLAGLSWSREPPTLREGLLTLSARAQALRPFEERSSEEPHGALPQLDEACLNAMLNQVASRVYWASAELLGDADDPLRRAIPKENQRIIGWGVEVIERVEGTGLSPLFTDESEALGPVSGDPLEALSLGEGGAVTIRLSTPAVEGHGAELAVFENSFNDSFLELAYVELSSNGVDFARLPSIYLGRERLGPFGEQPAQLIEGLAGSTRGGWSPPIDLYALAEHPLVQLGRVDLNAIEYIRVIDIRGDGSALDSSGRAIYDPYPTAQSAGFDLDGVSVLDVPRRNP